MPFDNLFGNLSLMYKMTHPGLRGKRNQIQEEMNRVYGEEKMWPVDGQGNRGPASVAEPERAPAMDKQNVDANFGYGGGIPGSGVGRAGNRGTRMIERGTDPRPKNINPQNINPQAGHPSGSLGAGGPQSGGGGGQSFFGPGTGSQSEFSGQMAGISMASKAGLAATMAKLNELKQNPPSTMSEEARMTLISDLENQAKQQKQKEMAAKQQAEQEAWNRDALLQDKIEEQQNMSLGQPSDNPEFGKEGPQSIDDYTNIQTAPTVGQEEEPDPPPFESQITKGPELRPLNAYKPQDLQGFKPTLPVTKRPTMPNAPKVPKGFKRDYNWGKIAKPNDKVDQKQYLGEVNVNKHIANEIKRDSIERPNIGEYSTKLLESYKAGKKPRLEEMPTAKEWEGKNMAVAGALRDLANIWLGEPIGGWAHAYGLDEERQKNHFMQQQQKDRDAVAKRNVKTMANYHKAEEAKQKLIIEQGKLEQSIDDNRVKMYGYDIGARSTDYETRRKIESDSEKATDNYEKNRNTARANYDKAVGQYNSEQINLKKAVDTAQSNYAKNITDRNQQIHASMAAKEGTDINNYKAVTGAQTARFNALEAQARNNDISQAQYQDRMQKAIKDSFDAAYKMNDQDLQKWKDENELALREKELLAEQNEPSFKKAEFQNKLNEDFKKSPAYKNYQYVAANFESLANAPLDNPFSVVGAINAATKIWDPNSVTRKSEFDNVQSVLGWFQKVKESGVGDSIEKENGGIKLASLERLWNRIMNKGSMTEIDRQDLLDAVHPAVKGWKDGYESELQQKKEFMNKHNLSMEKPDGSKYYGLSELPFSQTGAIAGFTKMREEKAKQKKKEKVTGLLDW
jgi:hypothetical protein